ncbi:MAG: glycosyltransferase family 39 protein [Prevotellaceae bacterium]|nr:glycosyltransferase family 39 protein [Prevotellaceae bacterium]
MSVSKYSNKRRNETVSKPLLQQKTQLFDKLENHFSKHKRFYLFLCLSTALIFSFLLFNINVSEAADDSLYIEAGYNYANNFLNYYYTFTAPLYCMFLALPIAIFGMNLVILKAFSVVFFVLGIFVLYTALKDRVRYIILFPALLLTALNSLYLYYASQTFTEAFVLPLSGLFLLALFKLDDATETGAVLKRNWKKFLLLGFVTFVFYMSRNVATIAIVIVFAYFMIYKKYLTAIYSVCSFMFFWGLYQKVIVPIFWGHLGIQSGVTGQAKTIFAKNSYNPAEGYEDFGGMVTRFFENAKTYSSQFFELIGLKSMTEPYSYLYFGLLLIFAGISLGFAIAKKQRYIIALILYVTAFLCVTFISLTAMWKQARMVMIYIPMIIAIVSYGIIMLLKTKPAKLFQWIYPAGIILLVLVNLNNTVDKAKEHFPKLQKNLAGNKYYGFTPDWVNYFLMSEWAAKNLAKDKVIACRKASMSFIYTGRSFSGISGVPYETSDSVLVSSNYKQRFIAIQIDNTPQDIVHVLTPYVVAILFGDKTIYYTYDVPEPMYNIIIGRTGIPIYTKPEELLAILKKTEGSYGVCPDKLLQSLKNRNVTHIIDASLRTNPAKNTGSTINTIKRYMNAIEQKYPGIFHKIHQIGANGNEPAMIFAIGNE